MMTPHQVKEDNLRKGRRTSMTNKHDLSIEAVYAIRVLGKLDQSWSDWFNGLNIELQDNETLMVGKVPDQAALLGILAKLGQLNLPLISINRREISANSHN
jgi:hypothetical protein